MLFFYVRHGDPIYDPDSLTPLGHEQAEALGKRMANMNIDEIYASTSERAKLTAKPLCERVGKEAKLLDFANEGYAWNEFTCYSAARECNTWLFFAPEVKEIFHTDEIVELGDRWYEHPIFAEEAFGGRDYAKGLARIQKDSDAFFETLGYKRVGKGKYEVVNDNDKRIALFAHQGFGLCFLSCLLGLPFPQFTSHFDMCTTGMTVIEFKNEGGFAYPRILMLSSDGHLYKEGLTTRYARKDIF